MKALLDTSVLVAGMIDSHPHHKTCISWLRKAVHREMKMVVASHSLAEFYHVLTRYPSKPQLSTGMVLNLIEDNIVGAAKVVSLSPKEYLAVIESLAKRGLGGGQIFDALIAKVAQVEKVDKLLTLNTSDFLRVWPDGKRAIQHP